MQVLEPRMLQHQTKGGFDTVPYYSECTMYRTKSLVRQIYYHCRTKIFGIPKKINMVQYITKNELKKNCGHLLYAKLQTKTNSKIITK